MGNSCRAAKGNGGLLLQTINDPGLVQIVGRHFHLNPVTIGEADETLPHFARDMGENFMLIVQLNTEHGSCEDGDDFSFGFNDLFDCHDDLYGKKASGWVLDVVIKKAGLGFSKPRRVT